MAAVTIREIRDLLSDYTMQQIKLATVQRTEVIGQAVKLVQDELALCEHSTATPGLKAYARVLDHYYEKSKAKRVATYEEARAALELVRQGMDSVSAIKKARVAVSLPAAKSTFKPLRARGEHPEFVHIDDAPFSTALDAPNPFRKTRGALTPDIGLVVDNPSER